MKHCRSLVSDVILFFLFNDTELVSPHANIYKLSNMYHDIEDYMLWSENRVETLFCECLNNDWNTAEKIWRIDQKLLQIFPFLSRVIDRSYLIEKVLTTLELVDLEDSDTEDEDVESTRAFEETTDELPIEVEPEEQPEQKSEEKVSPLHARVQTPELAQEPEPELTQEPEPELAQEPEPELALDFLLERVQEEENKEEISKENDLGTVADSVIDDFPLTDPKPAVIAPPTIPLNQSLEKLRRAASAIGIKNAFLMTKKQVMEKIATYNDHLDRLKSVDLRQDERIKEDPHS